MSAEAETGECWLCPTHRAVRKFADAANASLARKVVFRLQRMKASGIYGDDFLHKTLWDEYCHEVQNGPVRQLEWAWDLTIDQILGPVAENVPPYEGALLTIAALWDLHAELPEDVTFDPDLIGRNLRRAVAEIAGKRDLARFDPLCR